MKKLTKIFIAIMLLSLLFVPLVVSAEDSAEVVTDPAVVAEVEEGPLNSFWDAVQEFITSPSWGTLAAVGSALLGDCNAFCLVLLKKEKHNSNNQTQSKV